MLKKTILRDIKHLRFVRTLPCVWCFKRPCHAAHIRKNGDGGTGIKPSDNRTVPLCPSCHYIQHEQGELIFWYRFGGYEKAIVLAKKLYEFTGDFDKCCSLIIGFKK